MGCLCSTVQLIKHPIKSILPRVHADRAAFLYHAGLSYHRIERFVERSHERVQQWLHQLEHLFERECQTQFEAPVNETKVRVNGTEVLVWVTIDYEISKACMLMSHPAGSSLDALLLLREALQRCRGCPLLRIDRAGYKWPLELRALITNGKCGKIEHSPKQFGLHESQIPYYNTTDTTRP